MAVGYRNLLNGDFSMTRITLQDGRLVLRDGKIATGQACCCGGGGGGCGSVSGCTVTVSWNGYVLPIALGGNLNSPANCAQVFACGFYYQYAPNDPYPFDCPTTAGGWPAAVFGGTDRAEMCVHTCGAKQFGPNIPNIDPSEYDFYVDISTFFGAAGGLNRTNQFAFRFSGRQAVRVFSDTSEFSCAAIAAVADQQARPECHTLEIFQCDCDYSPPTATVTCPP